MYLLICRPICDVAAYLDIRLDKNMRWLSGARVLTAIISFLVQYLRSTKLVVFDNDPGLFPQWAGKAQDGVLRSIST